MLKNILKHLLIMIALTIIIFFTLPYCKQALQELVKLYPIVLQHLSLVFAGGKIGVLIKEVIAMMALPLTVSATISIGYYIIRRSWMPHIINTTWIIWIIAVSAIIVLRS